MNNYNRLINNLEVLKMDGIIKNLDNIIDRNVKGEIDFVEGLYELTHYQLEEKKLKEIACCIQWGAFPSNKSLEEFDFNFQPSINKEMIYSFKTLRFVEKRKCFIYWISWSWQNAFDYSDRNRSS